MTPVASLSLLVVAASVPRMDTASLPMSSLIHRLCTPLFSDSLAKRRIWVEVSSVADISRPRRNAALGGVGSFVKSFVLLGGNLC